MNFTGSAFGSAGPRQPATGSRVLGYGIASCVIAMVVVTAVAVVALGG